MAKFTLSCLSRFVWYCIFLSLLAVSSWRSIWFYWFYIDFFISVFFYFSILFTLILQRNRIFHCQFSAIIHGNEPRPRYFQLNVTYSIPSSSFFSSYLSRWSSCGRACNVLTCSLFNTPNKILKNTAYTLRVTPFYTIVRYHVSYPYLGTTLQGCPQPTFLFSPWQQTLVGPWTQNSFSQTPEFFENPEN